MTAACPICGAAATEPFWERVWNGPDKKVRRCPDCRSFFLWPPNTAAEQAAFDRGYDAYIAERARQVEAHAGASFDDLVDDSIAERMADIGHWFDGARSVMEVGAEKGGFLERLGQGGRDRLVGVDACPSYAELLAEKGFEAYRYLGDVPAEARFDRICFFSLLEHVPDPAGFLAEAASRLADGGLVVAEVPSARDPLVALYDVAAFKDFYFQAMHPFVYGVEALDILFGRAGLERVDIRFKQRYGLSNHLKWLKEGLPGGSPLFGRLFAGEADRAYVAALEAAGYADSVYVVGRRRA